MRWASKRSTSTQHEWRSDRTVIETELDFTSQQMSIEKSSTLKCGPRCTSFLEASKQTSKLALDIVLEIIFVIKVMKQKKE